jgi:hypothetical protein
MANAPSDAPVLDQFVAQIGPLAQQLGIRSFAFLGIDPTTHAQKFYGSPQAKAELRTLAGLKFEFGDSAETGWGE